MGKINSEFGPSPPSKNLPFLLPPTLLNGTALIAQNDDQAVKTFHSYPRMHSLDDQHVPSWNAFTITCSLADPPTTVAIMMPVLQAPADENDTMICGYCNEQVPQGV